MHDDRCDLSVVIPTISGTSSLNDVVGKTSRQLSALGIAYEIIVVDCRSHQVELVVPGAAVVCSGQQGYAGALRTGFLVSKGDYVLTMDPDCSHDPAFLRALWIQRGRAELTIASRYVPGGFAHMRAAERWLSLALNAVSRAILSLPVRDITSGFRLYHRKAVEPDGWQAHDLDVLIESIAQIYAHGWKVTEIPFHYHRQASRSIIRQLWLVRPYVWTLLRMWVARNSLVSADYDDRAFSSRIPLQRYWQRRRYDLVLGMLDTPGRILDIGCGSSKILEALPDAVGLDLNFRTLRFRSRTNRLLVTGDAHTLPFKNGAFDTVICSEVIEHIPFAPQIFEEFERVLTPVGTLVIGTPDYGGWQWPVLEWWYNKLLPAAHGHMHVERYTERSLRERVAGFGFDVVDTKWVARAEIILKCRKATSSAPRRLDNDPQATVDPKNWTVG